MATWPVPLIIFKIFQAGASPCISLPCSSSSLISSFITSLVSGQGFDKEQQLLASLLGIDKQSWKSGRTLDQPGDGHGFEKQKPSISILKQTRKMPEGKGLKMENEVKAQLLHNEKIKSEPIVKQDKKHKIGKEEIAVVEDIQDIKGVNEVKVVNAVKDVKGVKVVKMVKGVKGLDLKQTSESALCEICSKTFANRYILKSHTKLHGEKTDICDVCSKSFSNKHIQKAHMLTHTAEKVKCQMCLESVFGLKKHMKNKHGETKLVTCSNCGVEVKRISTHERFCRVTEEERVGLHNSNSFVLASQLEMMSLTINWNQFVGQRDPGIHLLPTYLFQLPTPPLCFLGIQAGKPP